MPGLAAEALRLASGASSYLVEGSPRRWWSAAGGLRCRAMRCSGSVPVAAWRRVARTAIAVDVLDGTADGGRLAGALVLLGGSAPELGGLRKTPCGPADALGANPGRCVEQLLAGRVRARWLPLQSLQPSRSWCIGVLAVVRGGPVAGLRHAI